MTLCPFGWSGSFFLDTGAAGEGVEALGRVESFFKASTISCIQAGVVESSHLLRGAGGGSSRVSSLPPSLPLFFRFRDRLLFLRRRLRDVELLRPLRLERERLWLGESCGKSFMNLLSAAEAAAFTSASPRDGPRPRTALGAAALGGGGGKAAKAAPAGGGGGAPSITA